MSDGGPTVEEVSEAARRNRFAWAAQDRRDERVAAAVLVVALLGAWIVVELAAALESVLP